MMERKNIFQPPPMGWNSWYCFSEGVSDSRIREVAAGMVERGFVRHGWRYINIDDCWQGKRGGKYQALQGNERFPDMASLGDHIHRLGLKFGLYSTPFIGTYAGFRGGSRDHTEEQVCIPEKERAQPEQLYGTWPGGQKRDVFRVGKEWLFDNDVRQWADWGVDFIKVDWNPIDTPTTERIAKALQNSGREILLSVSNNASLENAAEISSLSNLWRISGDVTDTWESIARIAFETAPKWAKYARPGHWNDLDMLQIGAIGKTGTMNPAFIPTRLSYDEQKSQFALWCMYSSPLLLSCDIVNMDDRTFGLVTNDALIAVDQDPLCAHPEILEAEEPFYGLKKKLSDGKEVLCIVNLSDEPGNCILEKWVAGYGEAFDVFHNDRCRSEEVRIPAHGCVVWLLK